MESRCRNAGAETVVSLAVRRPAKNRSPLPITDGLGKVREPGGFGPLPRRQPGQGDAGATAVENLRGTRKALGVTGRLLNFFRTHLRAGRIR